MASRKQMTLAFRLLRGWARVFRFRTLQAGNRYFRGWGADEVLTVPFAGYVLPLNVGRTTMHRMLALNGERLVAERGLIARLVRRGDRVCDVGANIGYYTLLFERLVGPEGKVVAIEPEPDNLAQLRRLVEVNGFTNVEILPVAAGEAPGEVLLERGLNGLVRLEGNYDLRVPVIAIDALADRACDVVKIDIEGFEGQALAGMRETIARRAPRLFVEVHPGMLRYGYTVRAVVAMVLPHYKTVRFWEESRGGSPVAKLLNRYWPGHDVRELRDRDALLASCEGGGREQPFWMICE